MPVGSHPLAPACARARSFYEFEFGEDTKLALDSSPVQLVRAIANAKLRPMLWRGMRPFVVAHNVAFEPTTPESGTLVVSGAMLKHVMWFVSACFAVLTPCGCVGGLAQATCAATA